MCTKLFQFSTEVKLVHLNEIKLRSKPIVFNKTKKFISPVQTLPRQDGTKMYKLSGILMSGTGKDAVVVVNWN